MTAGAGSGATGTGFGGSRTVGKRTFRVRYSGCRAP